MKIFFTAILFLLSLIPTTRSGQIENNQVERLTDILQRLKTAQNRLNMLEDKHRFLLSNSLDLPARCEGRLTTQSATPLSTSDRTSQGTIYFTPYHGSVVSLYDGTNWTACNFTELNLSLGSISSGSNYDLFVYDTGSCSLALELSTAWTNDTTRNDALTTVNGVYVKSGVTTRRYVGTIRASGAGVTEDSALKRFVWNQYNRLPRILAVTESTDSWSYTTTSFRAYNNSTNNQVQFVIGENTVLVNLRALALMSASSNIFSSTSIGLDSTTVSSALLFGGNRAPNINTNQQHAEYYGFPGIGYHYLQHLEYGASGLTYYGDKGTTKMQAGMLGEIDG